MSKKYSNRSSLTRKSIKNTDSFNMTFGHGFKEKTTVLNHYKFKKVSNKGLPLDFLTGKHSKFSSILKT